MELRLESLNVTLCKGIRMIVAIRRLAKDVNLDVQQLFELEKEVRAAAGQIQMAISARKNAGKPLILGY